MSAATVYQQSNADDRLAQLGLTQAGLGTVLLQADAEAAHVTPLDPPTAEGMARYAATVRYLRMSLMPSGWDFDNAGNLCRTISPDTAFAIVTSSGDGETGDPLGTPSTKYAKGETTTQAVATNQLVLDLGAGFDVHVEDAGGDIPTWFLLQRIEGDHIHAELSLPRQSAGGKINEWSERIVLDPIPRATPPVVVDLPDDDAGTAYTVDVVRR